MCTTIVLPAAPPTAADAFAALPQHIREQLEAEGVRTPRDWQRLGPRRFAIFGVTRAVAAQIDALARGLP
jgi:hypothetical protein